MAKTEPLDREAQAQPSEQASESMIPIIRVTIMSWCFQFLLDLLWIPLAAYFKDLDLGLTVLGAAFAANLASRILPNVAATRLGVKTDLLCMSCGLVCFAVNLVWPREVWAIFVMSTGGGLTFVRAHLSVHGKISAGSSKDRLTLCSKWCGAARNAGTVVAFGLPVILYDTCGWTSVILLAMCVLVLYIALSAWQHIWQWRSNLEGPGCDDSGLDPGLVEVPQGPVPWIDWVMAGAFCVTELQFNVQAAAVPTVLLRTFDLPITVVGAIQSVGQVVAMLWLVALSQGFLKVMQKRPMNLLIAFSGTFVSMTFLWLLTMFRGQVSLVIISLYCFYISAYTAQVTMLECILGVLDVQNSIMVMGLAEIFGCACSLVGGYLGPVLLEVDRAAPFALQMGIAIITTAVLAVSLGHRAVSQLVVCETEEQYDANLEEMIRKRPSIRKSLEGLRRMSKRPESYIGVEQAFRKASSKLLPTVLSSDSLCIESSCYNLLDASAHVPAKEAQGPGLQLKAPLLRPPPDSDLRRCYSAEVPMPDATASTYLARRYKKAMVAWDRSFIDIDTQDYTVNTADAPRLVVTHQRVRSTLN